MMKKYYLIRVTLGLIVGLFALNSMAAQIEIVGKHTRSDGSTVDFNVVDGDAMGPGDRFQIVITADETLYYAVLYVSREGTPAQIFPSPGQVGRIQPGAKRSIPGADNFFTLDVNGGRELMFIVTSPNKLSNLNSVLRGVGSVADSSVQIHKYLQKRLGRVKKLEITNTGQRIALSTDQVAASLVHHIERTYAASPWADTSTNEEYDQQRVRQGNDDSIPDAVRRRTDEVRSLLKRPRGTSGSSSLRTTQNTSSSSAADDTGKIRRQQELLLEQKAEQKKQLLIQKKKLADEARVRKEKAQRTELARQAAEQEALRLQSEREAAEQLESKRLADSMALANELRARQAALEQANRLKAERLENDEVRRLQAEQQALAQAKAEARRKEEERLLAEMQRLELARAEIEAKRLAELRAAEEKSKQAEAARQEAEIAAAEEQLLAEQRVLEEQLQRQELAEAAAGPNDKEESVFSKMLGLLRGDLSGQAVESEAEVTQEKNSLVVVAQDAEEVALNQSEIAPAIPAAIAEPNGQAPAAVVVVQAPARPAAKVLTAPAPKRAKNAAMKVGVAPAELFAEIASAIVSIRAGSKPQASGFMLDNKGHILTSWHVINGASDFDVSFMGVSGTARSFKARLIKYDKFRDLALLRLLNPPEGIQPIRVASNELPDAGTKVRVFGQKDGEVWATDDAVITRIAPQFTWFSSDNTIHRGEVLQIDLPVDGKDIGSLVTTMDYQMLGVKSFSGSQTGRAYAVSVRMIREFVEAQGALVSDPRTR